MAAPRSEPPSPPCLSITWVACVTANLLPSQSATLAASVADAIRVERPDLATVGRRMAGPTTAKNAIKRAWRFTDNHRIEVADAMAGVIARLVRKRERSHRPGAAGSGRRLA